MPHGVHNTIHLSSLTTSVINENQAFVVVAHNFEVDSFTAFAKNNRIKEN